MAKETFILRTEWYDAISDLKEKDQATMLRNLFEYHLENYNSIILNSPALKLAWKFIEPNLKRNITTYDARKNTSAENGKLGGRPKKDNVNSENNLKNLKNNLSEPNNPIVSVSVSVPDSVPVPDSSFKKEAKDANDFSEGEQVPEIVNAETEKRKKVARKKEKPPPEIPTMQAFTAFGKEKAPDVSDRDFELKYTAWIENGWCTGKGAPIVNWKTTLLNTIPYLPKNTNSTNGNTKNQSGANDFIGRIPISEVARFHGKSVDELLGSAGDGQ